MANVYCKTCHGEADWIDCWNGCDDGYFDGYEEDPLWYDEGDLITCEICKGNGGWYTCLACPAGASVLEAVP